MPHWFYTAICWSWWVAEIGQSTFSLPLSLSVKSYNYCCSYNTWQWWLNNCKISCERVLYCCKNFPWSSSDRLHIHVSIRNLLTTLKKSVWLLWKSLFVVAITYHQPLDTTVIDKKPLKYGPYNAIHTTYRQHRYSFPNRRIYIVCTSTDYLSVFFKEKKHHRCKKYCNNRTFQLTEHGFNREVNTV